MKISKKLCAPVIILVLLLLIIPQCSLDEAKSTRAVNEQAVSGMKLRSMEFTRSSWQMHQGEGLITFNNIMPGHGAPAEYDYAVIPPANDPGWTDAPDGEIIDYAIPSTLCDVKECMTAGQFTYFQTFVYIPESMRVSRFSITFTGIDDGVRVTLFNSDYRAGVVIPGSYVYLGGSGTANLANLVKAGENNRVVVTHVDDCCGGSFLNSAQVVINDGVIIVQNQPPAAVAGANQQLCAQEGVIPGTEVALDGSASSDPDGDALTYKWYLNGVLTSSLVKPRIFMPAGINTVELVVNDGKTDSKSGKAVVTITPPYNAEITELAPVKILREKAEEKITVRLYLPIAGFTVADIDKSRKMALYIGGSRVEAIWESRVFSGYLTNYTHVKIIAYFYSADILAVTAGYGAIPVTAFAAKTDGCFIQGNGMLTIGKYGK